MPRLARTAESLANEKQAFVDTFRELSTGDCPYVRQGDGPDAIEVDTRGESHAELVKAVVPLMRKNLSQPSYGVGSGEGIITWHTVLQKEAFLQAFERPRAGRNPSSQGPFQRWKCCGIEELLEDALLAQLPTTDADLPVTEEVDPDHLLEDEVIHEYRERLAQIADDPDRQRTFKAKIRRVMLEDDDETVWRGPKVSVSVRVRKIIEEDRQWINQSTMCRVLVIVFTPDVTSNWTPLPAESDEISMIKLVFKEVDVIAATSTAIGEALFKTPYNIIHWIGHGWPVGLAGNNEKRFDVEALASVLNAAPQSSLRLIFLNCCFSKQQGEELIRSGCLATVICVDGPIRDEDAFRSSRAFYNELGKRRDVAAAAATMKNESSDAPIFIFPANVPELPAEKGLHEVTKLPLEKVATPKVNAALNLMTAAQLKSRTTKRDQGNIRNAKGSETRKSGLIDAVLATIVRKSPNHWTGMQALENSNITCSAKAALREDVASVNAEWDCIKRKLDFGIVVTADVSHK